MKKMLRKLIVCITVCNTLSAEELPIYSKDLSDIPENLELSGHFHIVIQPIHADQIPKIELYADKKDLETIKKYLTIDQTSPKKPKISLLSRKQLRSAFPASSFSIMTHSEKGKTYISAEYIANSKVHTLQKFEKPTLILKIPIKHFKHLQKIQGKDKVNITVQKSASISTNELCIDLDSKSSFSFQKGKLVTGNLIIKLSQKSKIELPEVHCKNFEIDATWKSTYIIQSLHTSQPITLKN